MQSYNDVVTRVDANNNLIAIGSATVTVYLAGTLTVATIYSDDGVTLKANPFLSNSDGSFTFYAPSKKYDVTSHFTGYADKTVTYSSQSLGAMVYNPTAIAVPDSTFYTLSFSNIVLDTNSFVTSSTTLTIPVGVTKVIVTANTSFVANTTGDRFLQIYKNGLNGYPGFGGVVIKTPTLNALLSCTTQILNVNAGDVFTATAFQNSGAPLNTLGNFMSFGLTVVG